MGRCEKEELAVAHATYAKYMSTIQVRNVPSDVSRTLKGRAAAEGRSLSDYLLDELERIARRPTRSELWACIDARGEAELPPAASILEGARSKR